MKKLFALVNKLAMCIGNGLDNYEDHNPLGAYQSRQLAQIIINEESR